MMYSKIILMAIMVLSAIAMISADVEVEQRALRRRNKSKKSKSGKKDKSDKSSKSSKSKKSKSSKKKGVKGSKSDKSSKCDKSGKSGKSAKKDCRNPGEERVDIVVTSTVNVGTPARGFQSNSTSNITAFDVEMSLFEALTASSGEGGLPWEVECEQDEVEEEIFYCVAVKPDASVEDAAVIADSLETALTDGSFDTILSDDLGVPVTSDIQLEIATEPPTASPTDAPTVSPTESPTNAPVAPTDAPTEAPVAPTLAPSASAYPTTA